MEMKTSPDQCLEELEGLTEFMENKKILRTQKQYVNIRCW